MRRPDRWSEMRMCEWCGTSFTVVSKHPTNRFCGRSCSIRFCIATRPTGPSPLRTGPNGEAATQHPLYAVWQMMIQRCHNPNSRQWADYGERGIFVCDEWRADFWTYATYVGDRPEPGMSIDRIDNDDGYRPGNVRWATQSEQARNTRPRKGAP